MHAAHSNTGEPPSSPVSFYRAAFERLTADARYQRNIHWGEPRPGHPEGPIQAHIADLERNAAVLDAKLSEADRWRLRLLIHSHDTFKPDAADVKISHPCSHASLAKAFLSEFCPHDAGLLDIVQFHDEPYALWRQEQHGRLNRERYDALFSLIQDWDLFLAFLIADGSTTGKSREPLQWFFARVNEQKIPSKITKANFFGAMFHVVLVEPEIPPNTGNIARLCLAADADLHLVKPLGFSLDDKYLKRAGMDYWDQVRVTLWETWDALHAARFAGGAARYFLLTTKTDRPYDGQAFAPGDYLVFGRETRGLPESLLAAAGRERLLTIPMAPAARSLNLATAAGIVLFEALRQVRGRSISGSP